MIALRRPGVDTPLDRVETATVHTSPPIAASSSGLASHVSTSLCQMSPSRMSLAIVVLGFLGGCGTDAGPAVPPPLAGLQHAEVVRVGVPVTFDAQPSRAGALFTKEGVVVEQAAIVKYRFLAADGSATEEVAAPGWQHTFTDPGIYAVSLTVEDDRGRLSTARSFVHVTVDYTPTCSDADPGDCESERCIGDVCSRVACAAQAVCPNATICAEGFCYVTPPVHQSDDALHGADAGATGIDAADRNVP